MLRPSCIAAAVLVAAMLGCSSNDGGSSPIANPVPLVPQVAFRGGPTLVTPRITMITYPGEAQATALESFVTMVGASSYWRATTGEYGIGPATSLPPIHLDATDMPPTTSDGVRAWFTSKLDAADPRFGVVDANSLYVLLFPTGIDFDGCPAAGYHDFATLANGQRVAFAVLPRCDSWLDVFYGGTPMETDETKALTAALSHELIEAATDPLPDASGKTAAWTGLHDIFAFQGEVADLCYPQSADPNFLLQSGAQLEGETFLLDRKYTFLEPADLPFTVQRSWSNRAAMAASDPCQPSVAGQDYAAVRAILPDTITIPHLGSTPGVFVPLGSDRTIAIQITSDSPKTWKLAARDGSTGGLVSLDRAEATNGDTVHLTLHGDYALGGAFGLVYLLASDDVHTNISYVYVVVAEQ